MVSEQTLLHIKDSDLKTPTRKGSVALGKAVHVHDGDTLRIVVLDCYTGQPVKLTCRMHGYDSPELRSGGAGVATNLLVQQVSDVPTGFDPHLPYTAPELQAILDTSTRLVRVEFLGPDKYHRELVRLHQEGGICINAVLAAHPLNREYYGGKR